MRVKNVWCDVVDHDACVVQSVKHHAVALMVPYVVPTVEVTEVYAVLKNMLVKKLVTSLLSLTTATVKVSYNISINFSYTLVYFKLSGTYFQPSSFFNL